MTIAIVGGTGFVGRHLAAGLVAAGHAVTIVTRNRHTAAARVGAGYPVHEWDPSNGATLEPALHGQDAVINLAGESVAEGRWTSTRKQGLRASRIGTTRMMVEALSRLPTPARPTVLVSASGTGFYGVEPGTRVDETAPQGHGFLADLCGEWEQAAHLAMDAGMRTVCLRIGMVLGHDGGALKNMLVPFRLFLGGPVGRGTQPVSWIHVEDLGRLIAAILDNDTVKGPVNAVAPNPVTMKELCSTLGKIMGRPSWLPVPAFALRIALGELSTLLTHGQLVQSCTVPHMNFTYRYPVLESALRAILGKETPGHAPPPSPGHPGRQGHAFQATPPSVLRTQESRGGRGRGGAPGACLMP